MDWRNATRLGTMSGMLALSACMMPYDQGLYEAPPAPVYSAVESPDSYRFIDRADALWEAIGDAPPDHAFAFEGAEPWAWELQDGHRVVVEEASEGIRSYYFAPGDEGPFLAVRPGMSFGFDGEAVAVVYGPDGGAMPREAGAEHLGEGVELYARGRLLLRAMLPRQWRSVDSQAWIDTSPIIWGSVQIWDEGRRRHPGWGRHRDAHRDAGWRHRLEAERLRRQALADAFRRWREGGFQGPPPGRFHKPGDGHGPGMGRPHRPGRPGDATPGVGRPPRQPGQGRPPGAGAVRPPRQPDAGQPSPPRRGGWRGNRPASPDAVAPDAPVATPVPAPGAGVPGRPSWGGRPRPNRGDAAPGRAISPRFDRPDDAARPPRPEGSRPGRFGARPDAGGTTPTPPAARPDGGRSGRSWSRPERGAPPPGAPRVSPPSAPRASAPPAPRASSPPTPRPVPTTREHKMPDPE